MKKIIILAFTFLLGYLPAYALSPQIASTKSLEEYRACKASCSDAVLLKKLPLDQSLAEIAKCDRGCAINADQNTIPPSPLPGNPEAWNDAAKKYHSRYVQKCMIVYNNPNAASCCSDLAVADTNSMQKRGVFDTPTTAEIPIIVDENKCKAPVYKYYCSELVGSIGEKDTCKSYLNRCMEMGKWPDTSEETRKKLCETDYTLNKPIELTTGEKYINICLKSAEPKEGETSEDKAIRCARGYRSHVVAYRNQCIASLYKANYNPFATWFIQFRAFVFKKSAGATYEARSRECLKRYDQAMDKMLAE
ncbi:MAG: hypothetical protein Q7S19_00310 [bacterium]|nr:hypothetical protein [bacterium]